MFSFTVHSGNGLSRMLTLHCKHMTYFYSAPLADSSLGAEMFQAFSFVVTLNITKTVVHNNNNNIFL